MIAFLTNLAEYVGPDARFVHQGMTSSDILDTTLAVQMTRASNLMLEGIERLLTALRIRAHEFKRTPTIGRSHGIHAEPTTLGLKLATFYAEFARCYRRLQAARDEIAGARWAKFGGRAKLNAAAISGALDGFHMTCAISRASETMGQCMMALAEDSTRDAAE